MCMVSFRTLKKRSVSHMDITARTEFTFWTFIRKKV